MYVSACARNGISGQMHLRMSAGNLVNINFRHAHTHTYTRHPETHVHSCAYSESCYPDTRMRAIAHAFENGRDAEGAVSCHLSRRIQWLFSSAFATAGAGWRGNGTLWGWEFCCYVGRPLRVPPTSPSCPRVRAATNRWLTLLSLPLSVTAALAGAGRKRRYLYLRLRSISQAYTILLATSGFFSSLLRSACLEVLKPFLESHENTSLLFRKKYCGQCDSGG